MSKVNFRYIQVKEEVLKDIKNAKVNERISSRTDLVKKYNVTRTTIDRAISELIGEGFLYSLDGSGTYVSEKAFDKFNKTDINLKWAVILPNIMDDTYPGLLRGIEDLASKNGISIIICNTDNDVVKESLYIEKQIALEVNGLIIVPAISDNKNIEKYSNLKSNNIPFIFCNRSLDGLETPKVISNNFYGGYIVTKHLLERNYRNIAYVSKPNYSASNERYLGYISALMEFGIEINDELVVFEESFKEKKPGYYSTKKILEENKEVDAIFCFNDAVAKGAYDAIEEFGRVVGEDIGLVGYDNTMICKTFKKELTSVDFKSYEIGKNAAELLLRLINGENIKSNKTIVLQPTLEIRESTPEK